MDIVIVALVFILSLGACGIKISSLKWEIAVLKREAYTLDSYEEDELDDYNEIEEEIVNVDFEIDFKGMDVFSIERYRDGRTNIGYFFNGEVKEWIVQSSDECHEKTLHKFREYLAEKE